MTNTNDKGTTMTATLTNGRTIDFGWFCFEGDTAELYTGRDLTETLDLADVTEIRDASGQVWYHN